MKPSTIAKSLAIGNPADGYYCLKVIKETKGLAGSVPDPQSADTEEFAVVLGLLQRSIVEDVTRWTGIADRRTPAAPCPCGIARNGEHLLRRVFGNLLCAMWSGRSEVTKRNLARPPIAYRPPSTEQQTYPVVSIR